MCFVQPIISPKSKNCQLPADTTQESQNLGVKVERLCSECAITARVRQYYGGAREDFYDPVLLSMRTTNKSYPELATQDTKAKMSTSSF